MITRSCLALLFILLQPHHYYPETIDSLAESTHPYVTLAGTVTVVSTTQEGQMTFRLRDGHGHTVGCLLPTTAHSAQQPRVGVEVVVSGQRKVYTLGDRPKVVEIDPVDIIEPVE